MPTREVGNGDEGTRLFAHWKVQGKALNSLRPFILSASADIDKWVCDRNVEAGLLDLKRR
jgi:hypothetical protein